VLNSLRRLPTASDAPPTKSPRLGLAASWPVFQARKLRRQAVRPAWAAFPAGKEAWAPTAVARTEASARQCARKGLARRGVLRPAPAAAAAAPAATPAAALPAGAAARLEDAAALPLPLGKWLPLRLGLPHERGPEGGGGGAGGCCVTGWRGAQAPPARTRDARCGEECAMGGGKGGGEGEGGGGGGRTSPRARDRLHNALPAGSLVIKITSDRHEHPSHKYPSHKYPSHVHCSHKYPSHKYPSHKYPSHVHCSHEHCGHEFPSCEYSAPRSSAVRAIRN